VPERGSGRPTEQNGRESVTFLRAKAKHLNPMGGGFYQLGFKLQEVLASDEYSDHIVCIASFHRSDSKQSNSQRTMVNTRFDQSEPSLSLPSAAR